MGILAYEGAEPVAWCSIAPRTTHRGLLPDMSADPTVWSLTCFFVKRPWRGQGVGARLLEAAVAYARAQGARVIEGYPVDPESPSYRFMGFVDLFAQAGFEEIGRAGTRRHVVQLRVPARSRSRR